MMMILLTFSGDDVLVAGGRDDDVHLAQDVLDPDDPEAVHASLESVNLVDDHFSMVKNEGLQE